VAVPPTGMKTLEGPVTEVPPEGLGATYDKLTVPENPPIEVTVRLEVVVIEYGQPKGLQYSPTAIGFRDIWKPDTRTIMLIERVENGPVPVTVTV